MAANRPGIAGPCASHVSCCASRAHAAVKIRVKNRRAAHRQRGLDCGAMNTGASITGAHRRERARAAAAVDGRTGTARARRRLRRHRHEPAVRGQGDVQSGARHPADRREHPGRRLGDLLGADDRRVAQVRDARPARRTIAARAASWRCWRSRSSAVAASAAAARARCSLIGVFGAALFYGDAVLTPGDLGAVRGRRPRGGHVGVQAVRRADRRRRARRAVRDPAARHRRGRHAVRAGVRAVVRRPRRGRRLEHRARHRRSSPRSTRRMRCTSRRRTASPRSSCWARCCWPSPAPRRCTRTWVTSASAPSGSRGSASPRRRWCSTTSARARC